MDFMKAQVAASVSNVAAEDIAERLDLPFSDVEVMPVTDLLTRIRVRTPNGPRYFMVRLSEEI